MRVEGNAIPAAVRVENYMPLPGYVEVRLVENVTGKAATSSETGEETTLYEYDEYTLHVKDRDGLRDEIEANLADWLTTGRTLEVNEGASIVRDMQDALRALGYTEGGEA